MSNPAFVLIAITGLGNMSTTTYPTMDLCMEARNVALHGMTIEAEKALTDKRAADYAKASAEWDKAHPWRETHPPKTKNGFNIIIEDTDAWIMQDPVTGKWMTKAAMPGEWEGGAIVYSGGQFVVQVAGIYVRREPYDVKTAECVTSHQPLTPTGDGIRWYVDPPTRSDPIWSFPPGRPVPGKVER